MENIVKSEYYKKKNEFFGNIESFLMLKNLLHGNDEGKYTWT